MTPVRRGSLSLRRATVPFRSACQLLAVPKDSV